MSGWKFQSVSGYFAQDDPRSIWKIDALPPCFGLLDDSPDRWARFKAQIEELNAHADAGTSYKVVFLARHGEGFHNVAEATYGTIAWDDHYSKLYGDGQIVWGPDPELTELGQAQALAANSLWKVEMAAGMPIPQRGFCSPLTRAMRTAVISFDGVISNLSDTLHVLENCREENGVHTCDKRRTKSYIRAEFPQLGIEPGLMEEDELWDPERKESVREVVHRARTVFNTIFENEHETYFSITSHGGFIGAFLTVMGRPRYVVPTGGVLPVMVKGVANPTQN